MNRRKFLLVIIAISLLFLIPTAAFDSMGTDQINDAIELQPTEGPNGNYAVLNDSGKLELRFDGSHPNVSAEGLNPNSVTQFDRVFTVTNNGSEPSEVWFTIDSDRIRFYNTNDTDVSLLGQNNSTILTPGDTISVGVLIDSTDNEVESVETFTIHTVPLESQAQNESTGVEVSSDDTDDDTTDNQTVVQVLTEGQTRSVSIENPPSGGSTGVSLQLLIDQNDGGTVTLDETTLETSSSASVNIDYIGVESGFANPAEEPPGIDPLGGVEVQTQSDGSSVTTSTYHFSVDQSYLDRAGITMDEIVVFGHDGDDHIELDVKVDDSDDDGRIHFQTTTSGFQNVTLAAVVPEIVVQNASLNKSTIVVGERANATAVLENQGRTSGERQINLTVNGTVTNTKSINVTPGEQPEITFPVSPQEPGEYEIAIDGVDAGTLSVEPQPTPELLEGGEGENESGQPAEGSNTTITTIPGEEAGFELSPELITGVLSLALLLLLLLLLARRGSDEEEAE